MNEDRMTQRTVIFCVEIHIELSPCPSTCVHLSLTPSRGRHKLMAPYLKVTQTLRSGATDPFTCLEDADPLQYFHVHFRCDFSLESLWENVKDAVLVHRPSIGPHVLEPLADFRLEVVADTAQLHVPLDSVDLLLEFRASHCHAGNQSTETTFREKEKMCISYLLKNPF